MIDVNLLFEQANTEIKHIQEFNFRVASLDERKRKICTILPTDSRRRISKRCRIAKAWGIHHAPIWDKYVAPATPAPETEVPSDGGDAAGVSEQNTKRLQFVPPNAEIEWKEAERYPEFAEAGEQTWVKSLESGKKELWNSLEDVTNFQSDVEELNPEKIKRVIEKIKQGTIELPIVGRWPNGEYELIAGNTRIALLLRLGITPHVWVIDFPSEKVPKKKPAQRKPKKKAPATKKSPSKEKPKSSTERVRRYYKRHPEKVRKYLKKTQDDRVKRNGDRAKAIKKHGKAKMKNHDVHHPNGPDGGSWRLAKKDHGPDKKVDEMQFIAEGMSYVNLTHPREDLELTFSDLKELVNRGIGHGVQLEDQEVTIADGKTYVSFDEAFIAAMDAIKAKRLAEIEKLQTDYGLSDDHTLQDYKKVWWMAELADESCPITDADRDLLVKRWVDKDTTQRLVELSSPLAISWAHKMEECIDTYNANAMYPIQNIIAKIGVDSLKRSVDMLSAHNPFMANIVRTKLKETVQSIINEKGLDKLAKVEKLIGIVDEIKLSGMPEDGLTFSHKGNLYRFVDAFTPMERLPQPVSPIPTPMPEIETPEQPTTPRIIKKVLTIREREAVKSVLTKRISNPETKNLTLVKNALKLHPSHPAHRAASALIKQQDSKFSTSVDGKGGNEPIRTQ